MTNNFLDWQQQFKNKHWDKTHCNTNYNTNFYFFNSKAAKRLIKKWRNELLEEMKNDKNQER
ncbi:MAG: hypothetical protein R6U96_04640 [Promethearchaeia archaeon]